MATKKYIVRDGFVVFLTLEKADGNGTYTRTYESGEEVTLDDAQAALHLHKLELANQRDRDAALEAERKAAIARQAANGPADLVSMLVEALRASQGVQAPAPAPAATTTTTA